MCTSSEVASPQIKNISRAPSTTDDVHQLKVQPTKPPWKQKYDRNAKHQTPKANELQILQWESPSEKGVMSCMAKAT